MAYKYTTQPPHGEPHNGGMGGINPMMMVCGFLVCGTRATAVHCTGRHDAAADDGHDEPYDESSDDGNERRRDATRASTVSTSIAKTLSRL